MKSMSSKEEQSIMEVSGKKNSRIVENYHLLSPKLTQNEAC